MPPHAPFRPILSLLHRNHLLSHARGRRRRQNSWVRERLADTLLLRGLPTHFAPFVVKQMCHLNYFLGFFPFPSRSLYLQSLLLVLRNNWERGQAECLGNLPEMIFTHAAHPQQVPGTCSPVTAAGPSWRLGAALRTRVFSSWTSSNYLGSTRDTLCTWWRS